MVAVGAPKLNADEIASVEIDRGIIQREMQIAGLVPEGLDLVLAGSLLQGSHSRIGRWNSHAVEVERGSVGDFPQRSWLMRK
ncbi:hypothetical protein KEU06_20560 [Pseudaminobacter sp. 19-2017]|uniref:Uncharacterized protein n=1 Tax=Pseudaminobacter soli (ex Zhang et al. 2022) TaxID=2831468 RepID=A0A942E162_9HYPH|nr:hypothetical protein [Pseudaminobacter soli]MBS3651007.1 hypothetical protein [Pseudaminobacter soli]